RLRLTSRPPLFPYTTLFRSRQVTAASTTGWHGTELFIMPGENIGQGDAILQSELANLDDFTRAGNLDGWRDNVARFSAGNPLLRSEEHTSELQSRENLVCRL